jgi:hypothetical protein
MCESTQNVGGVGGTPKRKLNTVALENPRLLFYVGPRVGASESSIRPPGASWPGATDI